MYTYIYLCAVQCNGVKASPLSEIWLQSINHFHPVPTPPVSERLYSFLPQSVRHHLPENGAQLLQYFKLPTAIQSPVCFQAVRSCTHLRCNRRPCQPDLLQTQCEIGTFQYSRCFSIPTPGITIYVSANTIIATKSEIWSCATECYSDVCCLLMVLISSVALEGGLHVGSSHGRIESVANFVVLYLDFAHENRLLAKKRLNENMFINQDAAKLIENQLFSVDSGHFLGPFSCGGLGPARRFVHALQPGKQSQPYCHLSTQRRKHCLIIFLLSSFKVDNKLAKVSDHKHKPRVCTFLWER